MASPGFNYHLFRWKTLGSPKKKPVKNDDIDEWRKRVEMASELAMSEVFSHRKPQSAINRMAVPLESSEQLRDHDDAYSEAQALLDDWLSDKLRKELNMEDDDELKDHVENTQPTAAASVQPTYIDYKKFDDLYDCLVEEEEQLAVESFLQDLMKQELLDCRMLEELSHDDQEKQKKFRNPAITIEARHQQVRENRARREAEKKRKRREKEAQQDAMEEAKKKEQEEEKRKKQLKRREEEIVQQEMVRLRRLMEEKKALEHSSRQKKKEKRVQRTVRSFESTPALPSKQLLREFKLQQQQKIQAKIDMSNLQCLHKHLSGWHSVVLRRKLHEGKAVALCDWRRQLRAWRAWRAVVWAERSRREVARTEEQLRIENRQFQLAVENDQRRLLRRCLNEWQLWSQRAKLQRDLLAQQQKTKVKMAALINAAATGKLTAIETPANLPICLVQEPPSQKDTDAKFCHATENEVLEASTGRQSKNSVGDAGQPLRPWEVTRRHIAPTAEELHNARQRVTENRVLGNKRTASPAGRFENRHAIQKQIITQQRKLLKEQQEQITRLKEKQIFTELELEMEKAAQITQLSALQEAKRCSSVPGENSCRAPKATGEPDSQSAPSRKPVRKQTCPHPIITAMEARARQRAERRQEIEEIKKRKEEEKLSEMKAAEEQRQREEQEEKRKAAEKKREEKRLEREREAERQRRLKRHQELMRLACEHHNKTLLLHRGLAPWKRLMQLRRENMELAESHHNLFLLKQCTLGWLQYARETQRERVACADQLQKHFLLRWSLNCWKRLGDLRMIQEERAERFYRKRTLRRFLLALQDHVTLQRLTEWDSRRLAQQHRDRRVLQRCFQAWRQFPTTLRREREREVRREKLSRKVAELLPDFCSRPLGTSERETV
ncbi:coiled-coil domain-containing protein 191 isoform X2 [Poeciliopsis prolifica]|uniref:coiled-coil domain-containing protein 191 isoform X2 n=1 Tax=Poeciliopsis prolifica TaxID=188132 RepID=UPI0024137F47|nr:coiled-coil domain-containing protein 191 isoform X2 [Poeciliopsis prolifica]